MPGTTRYSATFDRTYEEDAKPSSPPNARRSRSQSWQANSGHDGRQYTPFASRSPAPRSSSQENNTSRGTEFIPTRTAKTSVKAHNNPFQFVKVGTCPLYKKVSLIYIHCKLLALLCLIFLKSKLISVEMPHFTLKNGKVSIDVLPYFSYFPCRRKHSLRLYPVFVLSETALITRKEKNKF